MVEPILLYGSEIWGYENIKIIEQVHLQFCKRILKVRTTTPNFMVYGELGRFPLEIKVKMRMVSYWNKLLQNEKLSRSIQVYRLLLSVRNSGFQTFKWLNHRRLCSQQYARYVPKIPEGRTHSYYPCHFNRYFPCQIVDRTQIAD